MDSLSGHPSGASSRHLARSDRSWKGTCEMCHFRAECAPNSEMVAVVARHRPISPGEDGVVPSWFTACFPSPGVQANKGDP